MVGASVGGLHLLQRTGPVPDAASIRGTAAVGRSSGTPGASCPALPTPARSTTFTAPAYRDGTYAATGHYLTPGGDESIGVSLTLVCGKVTASRVRVEAASPTARQFQVQFATRYANRVVSRDIADLNLSRVAGASLTSLGFDDAATQIRSAARA